MKLKQAEDIKAVYIEGLGNCETFCNYTVTKNSKSLLAQIPTA